MLLGDGLADEAWAVGVRYREQLGPHGWRQVLAARAETHPQEVVEPYRALIDGCLLRARDARRYDRALDLLALLQAVWTAAGDIAGFGRYVEELRVVHRIRPAFLRKFDAWSVGHPK